MPKPAANGHDVHGDPSPFNLSTQNTAALPQQPADKNLGTRSLVSEETARALERESEEKISINTDFFAFITTQMCCMAIVITTVVAMLWHLITESFNAHVELNGIIVGLTFFGLYRIVTNNLSIWKTARYLKRIENLEKDPSANEAQFLKLEHDLKHQGEMLDTQNMQMALKKMGSLGLFVINDNDARLIKSKLGSRVRHHVNHIPFFAGLLISFGLLGTFVGLIETVSAVAEQLGLVSASFGQPGGMDTMDLIKGISAPMGGMGTAFGASLFGLSGSMLLGGFNYMAGHGQNDAMENISRWLDDHIPSIKPGLNKQIAQAKAELERVKNEGKDDGTTKAPPKAATAAQQVLMAAGEAPQGGGNRGGGVGMEVGAFITLAEETHKHLRTLGHNMSGQVEMQSGALKQQQTFLSETQQKQETLFTNFMQQHQSIMASLEQRHQASAQAQEAIVSSLRQQYESQLAQQQKQLQQTEARLAALDSQLQNLGGTGGKIIEALQAWRTGMSEQYGQHGKVLQEMQKREQELSSMVKQLAAGQQSLQIALTSLPLKELKPTVTALEKLSQRVQSMLEREPKKGA